MASWKENLAIYQKSLRAFFQAALQICLPSPTMMDIFPEKQSSLYNNIGTGWGGGGGGGCVYHERFVILKNERLFIGKTGLFTNCVNCFCQFCQVYLQYCCRCHLSKEKNLSNIYLYFKFGQQQLCCLRI